MLSSRLFKAWAKPSKKKTGLSWLRSAHIFMSQAQLITITSLLRFSSSSFWLLSEHCCGQVFQPNAIHNMCFYIVYWFMYHDILAISTHVSTRQEIWNITQPYNVVFLLSSKCACHLQPQHRCLLRLLRVLCIEVGSSLDPLDRAVQAVDAKAPCCKPFSSSLPKCWNLEDWINCDFSFKTESAWWGQNCMQKLSRTDSVTILIPFILILREEPM